MNNEHGETMKYYLEVQIKKEHYAGSKAVLDSKRIAEAEGYSSLLIGNQSFHRFHLYDALLLINLSKLRKLKSGDILLISFPVYCSSRTRGILMNALRQARKKGVKYLVLIHDLDSLRFKTKKDARYEKLIMDMADAVIAHNERMAQYITDHYNISPDMVISLGIFDYLYQHAPKAEPLQTSGQKTIVIAGNLSQDKAGYIYNLQNIKKDLKYCLYGINADTNALPPRVEYEGSYDPDELPCILNEGFGLVWDGISAEKCEGPAGLYLRYNNPHKCSLYIVSGLPIIIWKEAALADFVERNGIGIIVGSLEEAEQKILQLSADEYLSMKYNLMKIGDKVRTGQFLKAAMKKAENLLCSSR